jgi:hypothetical protein
VQQYTNQLKKIFKKFGELTNNFKKLKESVTPNIQQVQK